MFPFLAVRTQAGQSREVFLAEGRILSKLARLAQAGRTEPGSACLHAASPPRALTFALLGLLWTAPSLAVVRKEKEAGRRIRLETLHDKIRGGWAGQMIGVAYGAPTEFKSNGKINEDDVPWSPEMVSNALEQDDLYVDLTLNRVLEVHGLGATQAQFAEAFGKSQYRLWHANLAARENLRRGVKPPHSGHPKFNIHANDIDFQIESDFIGLVCPGLPRASTELCGRVGPIMNYGDGVYGGMFVSAMYTQAFFARDTHEIVARALKAMPANSQYARVIRDLLRWHHQYPSNWRRTWDLIETKWNHKDWFCPKGVFNNYNIDAKLNGAYVAMGILYGRGDFSRTLEVAMRSGQDSDCNPSTAGGIIGTWKGYDAIPDQWKLGIATIADSKFAYTDYTFNTIVESSFKLALEMVARQGGRIRGNEAWVPLQNATAPRLQQWNPKGQAYAVTDAGAWKWTGDWTEATPPGPIRFGTARKSASPGSEVSCQFHGTGAVLVGSLETGGGKADVYLDGKFQREIDTSLSSPAGDESRPLESLWHRFDLRAGAHTLRLVLKPSKNGGPCTVTVSGLYRFGGR